MDAQHRMKRWMRRLFATLSLVASWGALAAVESVPPIWAWCIGNNYNFCTYATDFAAEQVTIDGTNAFNAARNLNPTGGRYPISTLESCDGNGKCRVTSVYPGGNPFTHEVTVYKSPACPVPTIYPTIPYKYIPGFDCFRITPSAFTITLSGGTEVEPSKGSSIKNLPFTATVKNQSDGQPPSSPVTVNISLKVDPTSGGHVHGDSTRPRGGIDGAACASDSTCRSFTTNGTVGFNFNAPEASGTHTITATCERCANTATKMVDVKVAGLLPIPPSGLYALYEVDGSVIGAVKGRHPNNHYLTPAAANRLLVIAINYHHLNPQAPVLHINDASLMWGGVFDIDVEADWNTPHKEHMRGTVVDIRANSRTGTIPSANFDAFIQLAKDRGMHAKIHSSGSNQHFHVRLLNRSE